MPSPVERLEEWCGRQEVAIQKGGELLGMSEPTTAESLKQLIAYREILEDFEATADGLSYDDIFTQGVRTGYAEVIEKLANAINPEETPGA